MKIKFAKSNIDIYGEIIIRIGKKENPILADNRFDIQLRGLKQSRSGVYCLKNKANGRFYIGMARDLEKRYNRHVNDLIKGIHHSMELQAEFNIQNMARLLQCSPVIDRETFDEYFSFEVIIYCRPSELTFYEHILITHLNPYYNIHKQKEIPNYAELLVNYEPEELED